MRRHLIASLLFLCLTSISQAQADRFEGKHYRGSGDVEFLELLDIGARMLEPDPQYQNMSMLYMPEWNGLVEGPTWDAWWIQNSYGTTYCALPFYTEPLITFLQNSQDLWFDQMGDGKRKGAKDWVAPDGCLCDAAKPGWIYYRQGDGQIDIHDWGMEFTAAGVVMQAELLLISRDKDAIAKYLPKLERSINFIESRRDPKNDLFLAGPAGNLLAPSYGGYKQADGTRGKGYLTGLSVTYIAALDRMIELEKLAKRDDIANEYQRQRDTARKGLEKLTTSEGYLVMSMDPDGTMHGVYGAPKHGYFEASPNHDAIAHRIVDDAQGEKIYAKIASIPQLRPYDFIIPNYPSYDDMYEKAEGLWGFGTWVNGGHWSTCEARMDLAYMRLGKSEDARKSMKALMPFARKFRMDNPLVKFGSDVYQPQQPINLCYDTFGPMVGVRRGLFEYQYGALMLTLVPHIPSGITEMEQLDPVRFGNKRIYLRTIGSGAISAVEINGKSWTRHSRTQIELVEKDLPDEARVVIALGGAKIEPAPAMPVERRLAAGVPEEFKDRADRLRKFIAAMEQAKRGDSYEANHARYALASMEAIGQHKAMMSAGKIDEVPDASRAAAEQSYVDTAKKLYDGFDTAIKKWGDKVIKQAWE